MSKMKNETVIKVNNVSKDFVLVHEKSSTVKGIFTSMFRKATIKKETQHALKNISLEIKKGEFFGIVGRNGSGKSTLLKILAGIYQPNKGNVSIKGKLVPFIELGVGFNPELSGRDNVYLNGAVLGFSKKEVDEMYESIVGFAELERFMDQKLKNYSSGMQVRLAFSMAVRANADILLVDEVLAVGDADFQRKCFSYFRKLKKNKKTVVFVTHDMSAVREYCDRAILIEGGKIAKEGRADDVAKEYTKMFVSTIQENTNQDLKNNNNVDGQTKELSTGKWGDGSINIKTVKSSQKLYKNYKEDIKIGVEFESLSSKNNLVIAGITIKNESGQPICGTNGKILHQKPIKVTKNKSVRIDWQVPNIFNDGTYFIEPAIVRESDMEVCQYWDLATSFIVVNEKKTPYLVSPNITMKVKHDF